MLGCVALCWVVFGCVGLCLVVLGCVALCWVVLGCVGLCWVVLDCVGLCWVCWVVFGCVGLSWVVLGCVGLCCVVFVVLFLQDMCFFAAASFMASGVSRSHFFLQVSEEDVAISERSVQLTKHRHDMLGSALQVEQTRKDPASQLAF